MGETMSVNLLSQYGDPIEKKGINECGLGETFPRYAEFWEKYVFRYRDRNDPSKLRPDYPEQLQDICNNHYYVFFHLTHAYIQLHYLDKTPLDQSIIDIGNPIYHLASAIDLTERTFVYAFRASRRWTVDVGKISQEDFDKITNRAWKDYFKSLNKFYQDLKPVNIGIHSVTNVFEEFLNEHPARANFRRAVNPIREYRNILIHGISPLRKLIEGEIYLPKHDSLSKYKEGRWSSPIDSTSDYEPAMEMIYGLAKDLVKACNNLWELLLAEMKETKIKELYNQIDEVPPPPRNASTFPDVENYPAHRSGYNIPFKGGSGQDF